MNCCSNAALGLDFSAALIQIIDESLEQLNFWLINYALVSFQDDMDEFFF